MNWTGGIKNRVLRGDINYQKASFHQQRRLVLAESLEPNDEVQQEPPHPQAHLTLACTPDNDMEMIYHIPF